MEPHPTFLRQAVKPHMGNEIHVVLDTTRPPTPAQASTAVWSTFTWTATTDEILDRKH